MVFSFAEGVYPMDLAPSLPRTRSLPEDKPWLYCGENYSAGVF